MKPVGDRCYSCEFYVYHLDYMNCSVPKWIPKKNWGNMMKRIPDDCPAINKLK